MNKRFSIESFISVYFLIILISLLSMQVFLRYVVNKSVCWSEEVSRWFFIWIIYFGCVLAAREDKHIRITVQLSKMPVKVQKIILTLGDLLWVGFSLVIGILGIQMVREFILFPYRSTTTGLNMFFVYLIIPISFLMMAFWVVMIILRRFKSTEEFELTDSRLDVD